jgi:ABC-2 type transport system permease protein
MNPVAAIALEEWRFWRRSRLALSVLIVFGVLLVVTLLATAHRMAADQQLRHQQQAQAEALFRAQPDRHPHRMVHYGHYVFRTPAPLAVFDPGIDRVAGQSIFLEGHRQNTPMFAEARASANVGNISTLTPALSYQMFLPLLLIALGHACIGRERESGTLASLLAQGVSGTSLAAGKTLALSVLVALLLLPAMLVVGWKVVGGESLAAGSALLATHALLLLVWVLLIVLVSMLTRHGGISLGVLILVWVTWALIVPRVGVAVTAATVPAPGHVESGLIMESDVRAIGDGHDHGADQFAQLRTELLDEHGVDRVEDLPFNLRGVVSTIAEVQLTEVLNDYAERRMAIERRQGERLAAFGWVSPMLAASVASRALAATDLHNHHRFMREAEALRFAFVQGLNEVHASELRYVDDINRSVDPDAEQRTRVSAEHWQLLDRFRFEPAVPAERFVAAGPQMAALLVWFGVLLVAAVVAARRLQP